MTSSALRLGTLVALGCAVVSPGDAQGAFETLDPFYGGETARRTFYGGFALSGEAAFRDSDLLGLAEPGAAAGGDLALAGRLDYALLPQVDLSLVADLSGGVGRGPMGLSWVVVKPYWRNEGTDYAVRVAVDPASEGGLGFRQTDVAFLSTTALGPAVTTDMSIGVRRVRTGYTTDPSAALDPDGGVLPASIRANPVLERLVGQKIRASLGYNVLFDSAGSRLAFGLVAEAGDYAIIRSTLGGTESDEDGAGERIRSGIGWLRAGVEFSRPSYQLAPFVSLPMVTWRDVEGEAPPVEGEPVPEEARWLGPRPEKVHVGFRVTLR